MPLEMTVLHDDDEYVLPNWPVIVTTNNVGPSTCIGRNGHHLLDQQLLFRTNNHNIGPAVAPRGEAALSSGMPPSPQPPARRRRRRRGGRGRRLQQQRQRRLLRVVGRQNDEGARIPYRTVVVVAGQHDAV